MEFWIHPTLFFATKKSQDEWEELRRELVVDETSFHELWAECFLGV